MAARTQALEDVKFGRALHQNLKTLARALHDHRPKAAVKFIFNDMLRSLRWCSALQQLCRL